MENKKCLLCKSEVITNFNIKEIFLNRIDAVLCNSCNSEFIDISQLNNVCSQCNKFKIEGICKECIDWNKTNPILINHSFYKYNNMLSEFFHIYKYLGDYRVRKILNEKIRLKTTKIFKQFDLVVPVPVSSKKRGFNQVKGIFGNSINDEYLSITKNFQMSKIDSDQRKNTEIKFEVLKDISGQKILLLDDVYTSGTTLHAVQDALLKAGAKYVESLTFAR